ncbi:uncharacterized protein LOC120920179 isoform X2 [Rana temporaria]|uniref:uncharacterized protein LOC120920179 isoform X2 n=1 Tax=Rana temporaria TaxID=8407 RepID=UPI001AAD1CB6|nr:uncharacterized protein LOC120920179 isoform X2 [Rana temporaria]
MVALWTRPTLLFRPWLSTGNGGPKEVKDLTLIRTPTFPVKEQYGGPLDKTYPALQALVVYRQWWNKDLTLIRTPTFPVKEQYGGPLDKTYPALQALVVFRQWWNKGLTLIRTPTFPAKNNMVALWTRPTSLFRPWLSTGNGGPKEVKDPTLIRTPTFPVKEQYGGPLDKTYPALQALVVFRQWWNKGLTLIRTPTFPAKNNMVALWTRPTSLFRPWLSTGNGETKA